MKHLVIVFISICIVGCKDQKPNSKLLNTKPLKYAKGFWIEEYDGYKDVYVRQSTDSSGKVIHYRLIQDNDLNQVGDPEILTVKVPIQSIVCTSTTHIPLLDYLNETDKLVGFPNTDYVSSIKARNRIDNGFVKELGVESNINIEKLIELQPSMVMSYTLSNDMGSLKKVQQLNIPVVINAEFLEQHPLGRAEWIKFMALFFNKESLADSVFNEIEKNYLSLQQSVSKFKMKPTVLSGIPYGGIWYLPGGNNYGAQFFKDAGCKYLWDDDHSTGFLKLSLEAVFEKALDADYWIGTASIDHLNDLMAVDNRFGKFKAFQNQKVYTYTKRIGPTGGNEYLELGYLRCDLVLKDLIQITHPDSNGNPDLYFFRALD